jgi:hypothetical protein
MKRYGWIVAVIAVFAGLAASTSWKWEQMPTLFQSHIDVRGSSVFYGISTFDSTVVMEWAGIDTMSSTADTIVVLGVTSTDLVVVASHDSLCDLRAKAETDTVFVWSSTSGTNAISWLALRSK